MFKRNGDKNVSLMCYAFIILTLNWDEKYEEYDLLLPESIVEYVIYHLKRNIKRKKYESKYRMNPVPLNICNKTL